MMRRVARAAARLLPAPAKAALARWRFGHGDAGLRIAVTRQHHGDRVTFRLPSGQQFVARGDAADAADYHFVTDGDSRTEMASFLKVSAASPADALLLDVGAHIGLFAVVHLALAPAHRAVLFEPSPPLSSASADWLALNAMTDRGAVRCAGVGNLVETRMIEIDALGFAVPSRGTLAATEVPFTTIDHVCRAEGLRPAIIKIDVEGHEREVLVGARETLARDRPILCLELHLDVLEQRGGAIAPLLALLEATGYTFETSAGTRVSALQLRHSLKAILRIVARPAEAPR